MNKIISVNVSSSSTSLTINSDLLLHSLSFVSSEEAATTSTSSSEYIQLITELLWTRSRLSSDWTIMFVDRARHCLSGPHEGEDDDQTNGISVRLVDWNGWWTVYLCVSKTINFEGNGNLFVCVKMCELIVLLEKSFVECWLKLIFYSFETIWICHSTTSGQSWMTNERVSLTFTRPFNSISNKRRNKNFICTVSLTSVNNTWKRNIRPSRPKRLLIFWIDKTEVIDQAINYIQLHSLPVKTYLGMQDQETWKEFPLRPSLSYVLHLLTDLSSTAQSSEIRLKIEHLTNVGNVVETSAEDLLQALADKSISFDNKHEQKRNV